MNSPPKSRTNAVENILKALDGRLWISTNVNIYYAPSIVVLGVIYFYEAPVKNVKLSSKHKR